MIFFITKLAKRRAYKHSTSCFLWYLICNQVYKWFRRFGHNLAIFSKFTNINKNAKLHLHLNLILKFNGYKYNYKSILSFFLWHVEF